MPTTDSLSIFGAFAARPPSRCAVITDLLYQFEYALALAFGNVYRDLDDLSIPAWDRACGEAFADYFTSAA